MYEHQRAELGKALADDVAAWALARHDDVAPPLVPRLVRDDVERDIERVGFVGLRRGAIIEIPIRVFLDTERLREVADAFGERNVAGEPLRIARKPWELRHAQVRPRILAKPRSVTLARGGQRLHHRVDIVRRAAREVDARAVALLRVERTADDVEESHGVLRLPHGAPAAIRLGRLLLNAHDIDDPIGRALDRETHVGFPCGTERRIDARLPVVERILARIAAILRVDAHALNEPDDGQEARTEARQHDTRRKQELACTGPRARPSARKLALQLERNGDGLVACERLRWNHHIEPIAVLDRGKRLVALLGIGRDAFDRPIACRKVRAHRDRHLRHRLHVRIAQHVGGDDLERARLGIDLHLAVDLVERRNGRVLPCA